MITNDNMDRFNQILAKIPELDFCNYERKKVEAKLNERKIPNVFKPEFENSELKFPGDVTRLDDSTLGQVYSEFMSWTAYTKYVYNLKEADVLLAKNTLSNVRKMLYEEARTSGRSNKPAEIKLIVEHDPIIISLEKNLMEIEVDQKTIEARFNYFETCAKSLSREISRRTAEYERH